MTYAFIAEQCSDLPISTCCRVMGVSTSGFYQRRNTPVTNTELAEAYAANDVFDIWKMSRHSYGSPQVDLVNRAFDPAGPDRLWVMDVTEHPTAEGKVYLAVVVDAWARRVVGWSIADHLRAELVADAVQMATWRRQPPKGQVIAHSDHGAQYTSWLFGQRLRQAGLLGSMGTIGDCFDNSVAEALFSILQRELLDQHHWATRDQLAAAIFEWIEVWYNPHRRHSYNDGVSPIDCETANAA